MLQSVTIAVAKGRILEEAIPLLAELGVRPLDELAVSRKLVFQTSKDDVRLVVIRAQDVPTFVEYGAADLGIVGKDVLLEYERQGVYEPLDLGIAKCRLVVAGLKASPPKRGRIKVATKYVAATRRHFAAKGQQVEIIKLYGSMELAPVVGLADWVVDLVDTGSTLSANGLVELEQIMPISARLIVNRASMKMKHESVKRFIAELAKVLTHKAPAGSPPPHLSTESG